MTYPRFDPKIPRNSGLDAVVGDVTLDSDATIGSRARRWRWR